MAVVLSKARAIDTCCQLCGNLKGTMIHIASYRVCKAKCVPLIKQIAIAAGVKFHSSDNYYRRPA